MTNVMHLRALVRFGAEKKKISGTFRNEYALYGL